MEKHPLRAHLEHLGRALNAAPMRARIDAGTVFRLGPAATPDELAGLEADLGAPLPATLREVLGQVSADIEIVWSLRGRQGADGGGLTETGDLVLPPEPFMEWDEAPDAQGNHAATARRRPSIESGGIRFSLQGVRAAAGALAGWQDSYADNPDYDAETRDHFSLICDFMGAGLPVWTAPNGDWLAIDLRDDSQQLLHVSHEGEEAGFELGLTLPQFIAHLSWLGPLWPDYSELFAFSDPVVDIVPGDPRLRRAHFDARGKAGLIWRQWFWDQAGLPDPAPEILG